MNGLPLFSERQRFTQPLLWLLILGVAGMLWYGMAQQFGARTPWGTNPAPDAVLLIVLLLCGIGVPLLFALLRLETDVHEDGIRIRFFPVHRRPREWRWEDIESVEVHTYSPLREYGGWGIRLGPRGVAYNVRGNRGVELRLRNRQRVLIGTQDPDGFRVAIEEATSTPRR